MVQLVLSTHKGKSQAPVNKINFHTFQKSLHITMLITDTETGEFRGVEAGFNAFSTRTIIMNLLAIIWNIYLRFFSFKEEFEILLI